MTHNSSTHSNSADPFAVDRQLHDAAERLVVVLRARTAVNDPAQLRETVHLAVQVLKQAAATDTLAELLDLLWEHTSLADADTEATAMMEQVLSLAAQTPLDSAIRRGIERVVDEQLSELPPSPAELPNAAKCIRAEDEERAEKDRLESAGDDEWEH